MKTTRSFLARVNLLACLGGLMAFGVGTTQAGGPAVGATVNGGSVVSGGHPAAVASGGPHVSAPAVSGHYRSTGLNMTSIGLNANRANQPSASHAARPGILTTPVIAPQNGTVANAALAATAAQARNAWTDPAPAIKSNVTGGHHQGNHFSGTVLFPDAYQDIPGNRFGSNHSFRGGYNYYPYWSRFRHRGYYDPYAYYAPYGVGGYTPYVNNDLASVGTPAGDYDGNVGDSNALSADAASNLSRPYPPATAELMPPPMDTAPAPPAPIATSPTLRSNTGPDSLVEAVQAELSRRGYFGGKVDAIYNEATHAAIQRFQTDQQLSATGRINEATLHALQLD